MAKPKEVPEVPNYPKSLLSARDGNLFERVVHNQQEEAEARAQGFKTDREWWP